MTVGIQTSFSWTPMIWITPLCLHIWSDWCSLLLESRVHRELEFGSWPHCVQQRALNVNGTRNSILEEVSLLGEIGHVDKKWYPLDMLQWRQRSKYPSSSSQALGEANFEHWWGSAVPFIYVQFIGVATEVRKSQTEIPWQMLVLENGTSIISA